MAGLLTNAYFFGEIECQKKKNCPKSKNSFDSSQRVFQRIHAIQAEME